MNTITNVQDDGTSSTFPHLKGLKTVKREKKKRNCVCLFAMSKTMLVRSNASVVISIAIYVLSLESTERKPLISFLWTRQLLYCEGLLNIYISIYTYREIDMHM
jgi:hypothetical protein